jgi:hypothetical protein
MDRDILERPALFYAAHHGSLDSYLTLVDAGANIHDRDSSSQSILGAAAAAGSTEIVRDLLDRGVSPNDDIFQVSNPLHGAAKAGHHEVVRLLLANGAWANYLFNGKTAAQVASENGFPAISAMVEEATLRKENDFCSWYNDSTEDSQSGPAQRQTQPGSRPTSSYRFVSGSSSHANALSSPLITSFASLHPSQHADQDNRLLGVTPDSTPREPLRRTGGQVASAIDGMAESSHDIDEAEDAY